MTTRTRLAAGAARANPSTVICRHDGMTMTFPNFGAMVQHMQEMTD